MTTSGVGADGSRLERLAREGEERRVAAAAEEEAVARLAAIQQRRQVRRLGLGNLLDALAERPPGHARPLLPRTLAVVAVSVVLWLGGEAVGAPAVVSNAGLAGVLAVPFLHLGVRRWQAVRDLRRERGWLQDLPFPVRGYFAMLSTAPCEERTVEVRFELRDEGPGEEIVRGLAGRAGGAVRVARTRTGWKVESGVIHSPAGGDMQPTNGPLLSWMRGFITETLLPLHAEHRVTGVRFLG